MPHDLTVLLDGLASPDPTVRDGWAYQELAEGIIGGRFAADLETIRGTTLERLRSDEIHARTFAPLILEWLIDAGDRCRATFEAVTSWYAAEQDTRGYDQELGWLHAVAHGADYLARAVQAQIATGAEVLDVLARRIVAPGELWRDQEDARVARAAIVALSACHSRPEATAWLTVVSQACQQAKAGARDSDRRHTEWEHNVYATCSTLYVALAEQSLDGREVVDVAYARDVRDGLADIISAVTPWLITPRREPASAPSSRAATTDASG